MRFPISFRSIALVAFASIGVVDFLFYEEPLGASAAVAGLYFFGFLLWQMPPTRRKEAGFFYIAAAFAGLLAALAWNPTPLPILLTATTLALLAIAARTGGASSSSLWLKRLAEFAFWGWMQLWRDSAILDRWKKSGHASKSCFAGSDLKRRWLFPISITLGFLILFTIANPIISNWIGNSFQAVERFLSSINWPSTGRITLWIITLPLVWTLLRFRPKSRDTLTADRLIPEKVTERISTDTLIRSLILLNILFAFMNLLDLRYLWGGATLPDGMTYAEYAQRGAYPLVLSALLAGFFVIMTFRSGGASEQSRLARMMVGIWILQNIFLTVSAGWRLGIYIDIYSLTRLRLAATIWMGLVACGLVWISFRILWHKDNRWLIQRNILTLGAVLYIAAFLNFDGYIARYNTTHCREVSGNGAPLDWDYLKELGPEALPSVRRLKDIPDLDVQFQANRHQAQAYLERQLQWQSSNWRGWSLLHYRLRKS